MNNTSDHTVPVYPQCTPEGCLFRVWAPERKQMQLELVGTAQRDPSRDDRTEAPVRLPMTKDSEGFFSLEARGVLAGQRYYYYFPETDKRYPDPASCWQPEGIHGPSAVVDHEAFRWSDERWKGRPFGELVFYELHVGAFTPEGTFDAVIPRLDELAATGITAIELMPAAQCPGTRNWGYDGVFLYAVQNNYGGPEGLRRLVDACHARGIAVFLDVVYNHVGVEGNCLAAYGPYFSDKYRTPWGEAMNFDGAWSDGVRDFITGNALHWAQAYHIDGLRLDAIHEIYDRNAVRIWDELYAAVKTWEQQSGRRFWLVAESDGNDPRVVRPPAAGGLGFDGQWLDDFHHALYVLLDPDGWNHYRDFGSIEQLAKAWTEGFVHSGEYVRFRHRRHGASSAGIDGGHFIVFNQNHDLPGNRPDGKRLSQLAGLSALKVAAASVLLSPYVPMLFMGEEYGEDAPFYFFSDYRDPGTVRQLQEGRRQQFASFDWKDDPRDPQDESVFRDSRLRWEKRLSGHHAVLLDWHRRLLALRREHPVLSDLSKKGLRADVNGPRGLSVYRYTPLRDRFVTCLFNFSFDAPLAFNLGYASAEEGGDWKLVLSSAESVPPAAASCGTILVPPMSVAVYERDNTGLSRGTKK
ncbi:MAG TPA: malto-oligosyltrehalose trehalohydrolase [Puia sp.]|nr:malto-oligosyltrehalose trehalohydrolase [Puia sp.]